MKITTYRNVGEKITQRIIELETALNYIRTEIKSKPVTAFRNNLFISRHGESNQHAEKLPVLVFGGAYSNKNNQPGLLSHNGLVTLELKSSANWN